MAGERILVVEDTSSVAKLVATHLQAAGYQPEIAASGPEALSMAAQSPPHLFVVDVMMPGMDGFQVTERVRADPKMAHVPVIILTARDSVEDKVRGFEAGADDYVIKPFEAPELLARVRALLARSQQTPTTPSSQPTLGTIIAAFGLRGGSGRSSVIANLAVAIAGATNGGAVACDLAIESGHLALMLDARPIHSVDQLITRYGAAVEPDVLLAYLTESNFNVRLLSAPLSPASAPLVSTEGVRAVLDQLRRSFAFVLVDLSPGFSDLNLAVLEMADSTLVVTTPEMAGVKAATSAFAILESLGYPAEATGLVVNQVFAARPLNGLDISAAVGREIELTIPYEKSAFVDAINRGAPVVVSAPRSAAARAIAGLSAKFVGNADKLRALHAAAAV